MAEFPIPESQLHRCSMWVMPLILGGWVLKGVATKLEGGVLRAISMSGSKWTSVKQWRFLKYKRKEGIKMTGMISAGPNVLQCSTVTMEKRTRTINIQMEIQWWVVCVTIKKAIFNHITSVSFKIYSFQTDPFHSTTIGASTTAGHWHWIL